MFEEWSLFISAFVGFAFLGFLIYILGNRKTRTEEMKYETYTCGEPFPKVYVSVGNFYHAIRKALGVERLSRYHTGRISDYLLWVLAGTVIIILLIIAWGGGV